MQPVLLSIMSSSGFASAKDPFSSPTPVALGDVNLSEPVVAWSPDRQLLAAVSAGDDLVQIISVASINEGNPVPILSIAEKSVSSICFSQKSSWICTWRKPSNESDLNMAVWSLETGACVVRARRTRLNSAMGDPVQWSANEKTVWILSGAELLGYEIEANSSHDPCRHPFKYRLHVPDMVRFWLAPLVEPCFRVLVLVAEKKGEPARCVVYNSNALDTPVCAKSFYQSDDVEAQWSPAGHAVLVKASAAHDASGKSYYGSASLYLLPADGYNQSMTIVSAGSDGACADAQWNPIRSKREFGVICGRRAWICNSTNGKCVIDFGSSSWNTFRYSPSGRYVALGGFGNLPGTLWFFDRTEKRFLGTGVDHSSKFICWSPDSQYVLTARMFPARRVENGLTLFSYAGETIAKHEFEKLLDVQVLALMPLAEYSNVPTPAEVLDRSQSIDAAASCVPGGASGGAYIPPNARKAAAAAAASGTAVQNNVSSMLQQLRDSHGPQKVGFSVPKPKTNDPETAALKQAKKERRKAKAAAAQEASIGGQDSENLDRAKTLKSLNKKLRQIQQLKEQVKDNGLVLNAEQIEKLSRENDLIKQIEALSV